MAKTRAFPSLSDVIDIDKYLDEIQYHRDFIKRYEEKINALSNISEKSQARAQLDAFTIKLKEYTEHNNHHLLVDINKFLEAAVISVDGTFSTLHNQDIIQDDLMSKLVPIIYMLTQDKRRDERIKKEFDETFSKLNKLKATFASVLPGSTDEADLLDYIARLERRLGIIEGEEARVEWQKLCYLKNTKYKLSYAEEKNLAQHVIQLVLADAKKKIDELQAADSSATSPVSETLVQSCISVNFKLASFVVELLGHIQEAYGQKAKSKVDLHARLAEWLVASNVLKDVFSDLNFRVVSCFAIEAAPLVELQDKCIKAKEELRKSQRQSRLSGVQEQGIHVLTTTISNVRASVDALDIDILLKSWEDMQLSDSLEVEATPFQPQRSLRHARSKVISVLESMPAKATSSAANHENVPAIAMLTVNLEEVQKKSSSSKKSPFRRLSTFFGESKPNKAESSAKSDSKLKSDPKASR